MWELVSIGRPGDEWTSGRILEYLNYWQPDAQEASDIIAFSHFICRGGSREEEYGKEVILLKPINHHALNGMENGH